MLSPVSRTYIWNPSKQWTESQNRYLVQSQFKPWTNLLQLNWFGTSMLLINMMPIVFLIQMTKENRHKLAKSYLPLKKHNFKYMCMPSSMFRPTEWSEPFPSWGHLKDPNWVFGALSLVLESGVNIEVMKFVFEL